MKQDNPHKELERRSGLICPAATEKLEDEEKKEEEEEEKELTPEEKKARHIKRLHRLFPRNKNP